MSLALSIFVLFISLMQSVNGAQLLNTTCILFFSLSAANGTTVIAPLASICASLYSDKLDLKVLNLI